ncbi:HNH endonuclease [Stenotrophomonas sp. TWI587]|uniref:HNH endonuclease n=2 Tax=unclassified Stenotrophomonas TaxID=196198 RepID=UPI003209EAC4
MLQDKIHATQVSLSAADRSLEELHQPDLIRTIKLMGSQPWQLSRIKSLHILKAASVWDRRAAAKADDVPFFKLGFRESARFDVLIKGQPYPPKAIASCAHGLATGSYVHPSEFAGAKDGVWHRLFNSLGFQVVAKRSARTDDAEDVREILSSGRDATTCQRLIEARLGQGKYRDSVLDLWNRSCAVTGCETAAALRASHIKPWRTSNDRERLNPENGLPLIATLDALFDKNLVSFDDNGLILISKMLEGNLKSLGIKQGMRLRKPLTRGQKKLLAEHRLMLVGRDAGALPEA